MNSNKPAALNHVKGTKAHDRRLVALPHQCWIKFYYNSSCSWLKWIEVAYISSSPRRKVVDLSISRCLGVVLAHMDCNSDIDSKMLNKNFVEETAGYLLATVWLCSTHLQHVIQLIYSSLISLFITIQQFYYMNRTSYMNWNWID